MAEERNSYLVSKALKSFMFASVLASLAQRLATMTDAIVVSNLIGPDAISAINVVTPITTLFPTVSILFGVGGSILAAKALGQRNANEANSVFTASLLGALITSILLAVVLFAFTPEIVALVCPRDSRFFDLAVSFSHIIAISAVPMILGFTLQNFVKTDGNPRLVMVAVLSSTILNLVLDVVFIKYFGMGIAGSAWGTIICFVVSTAICLIHFRSSHNSFRLQFDWSRMRSNMSHCVAEGFPMSINTFMMGVCVFGFNSIVMRTLGADGMYVWSVCLQLLMLFQLMLSGVGSSIYSIGGMLIGERDTIGLNILIRRVLAYVGLATVVLLAVIEVWPGAFGSMFGGHKSGMTEMLHDALRVFSFLLLPYALITALNALYQLLGYRTASIVISVGQLVLMVAVVWLFALMSPSLLWWGFPAASLLLVLTVLTITWMMHLRRPEIAPVTLIPQTPEAEGLNFSVRLAESDVAEALNRIVGFLEEQKVPSQTARNVRLCSEELMYNIVRYAVKRHPDRHFIDVHIRCTDSAVSVLLKDDGRPFNPTLTDASEESGHLGLRLVNNACRSITYQYMYDQNMVYMTF